MAIASVAVATLGLVYKLSRDRAADQMRERERLVKLETRSDLLWKIVEANVPRLLKHPHTPRMDSLLEKMTLKTLDTWQEATELLGYMKNELKLDLDDPGRMIAMAFVVAHLEQITSGNGAH